MSTGHELEPTAEVLPPVPRAPVPAGPESAAHLASLVGNRAFARSVTVREQQAGPTVQRLIPLAIIGAGLIYVSGEQRGWWGGDEEAAAGKVRGGPERLAKVKDERAANERARHTLNNQVLGTLDSLSGFVRGGTKEGAVKAVNFGRPLFQVLPGLDVGKGQKANMEAAQDQFGEGLQTAAALTETRAETIAMVKTQNAGAASDLQSVIAGAAAPAAGSPAPAPGQPAAPPPAQAPAPAQTPAPAQGPAPTAPTPSGPPTPPIPADVIASLKGVVETLGASQTELDGLGEKGDPGDLIKLTEDIEPQLSRMSASVVGEQGQQIQSAGFKVRNGVRHLRALSRTREENGAHAADAFVACRNKLGEVFHALVETDKALAEEEKQLRAEQKGGGDEVPPPTEGGK